MSGVIFLIQGEKLVEMREEEYDSEDLLQKLLADYPKILAGDQINSENPRKWLLISREMGVRDELDAPDRWSLDHLFIDQEGIPTFVEVKRSTDTRIRREVVAQMLDYAANGIEYWKIPEIKVQFEHRCSDLQQEPAIIMQNALGPEIDYEKMWDLVKVNLEKGKVRLLFVADEIPKELKRIVEFLNEKMEDVEVLAIEVKQFTGENLKTLVPRVIGQTSQTENKKETIKAKNWNNESFLVDLKNRKGEPERLAMEKIFDWIKKQNIESHFGQGKKFGNWYPHILTNDDEYTYPLSFETSGQIGVGFINLKETPAFADDIKRKELISKLNTIPNVNLQLDKIENWRNFSISSLVKEEELQKFLEILDEIIKRIYMKKVL